ncbi:MAG: helix-turn-helix domain-containing protein [bacterium]
MKSIQETLMEYGFDPSEAEIYVILQQNGELDVPTILGKTNLSRASVYDSLNFLISKEFVEYRKQGRRAFYRPSHPTKLFGLIEQKKRESSIIGQEMEQTIRDLTGMYNITQNKPGVRFFEGKEGLIEALYDTLNETGPIYAYIDSDAVDEFTADINKDYIKKRIKKGISKKILALDTPETRKVFKEEINDLTEFKFLPKEIRPFGTAMQIYGNKISYFTLRENDVIALIIDDPHICQMHKNIFAYFWNKQEQKTIAQSGDGSVTVFDN